MSEVWQVSTHWQSQSERSHHDVHLHPLTNVPTKCKKSTPYRIQEPRQDFKTHGQYKVKDQIKITPWCCTPTTPSQSLYQVSISYTLRFQRYSPNKILQVKVITARSKVKSRSYHDVTNLQPPPNVSTKYQLPTPYSLQDIGRTRFYRSRSLRQGQIKVTPWRCTSTPSDQYPYHVSASYTLLVWDIAWTRFSN